MKTINLTALIFLFSLTVFGAPTQLKPSYSVPKSQWPEALGNHRAVLEIPGGSEVIGLNLVWRRHDVKPDTKRLLIISDAGDTIPNIYRYTVNNERCTIAFGPVKRGGPATSIICPMKFRRSMGIMEKTTLNRRTNLRANG